MKKKWVAANLLPGLLASCAMPEGKTVGGERDSQACLTAAGYTWSKVQHACIRIFESGVAVRDAGNTHPERASFAVFGRNGERAKLFLPYEKESLVLDRNGAVWTNGSYTLRLQKAEWVLEREK